MADRRDDVDAAWSVFERHVREGLAPDDAATAKLRAELEALERIERVRAQHPGRPPSELVAEGLISAADEALWRRAVDEARSLEQALPEDDEGGGGE